MMLLLSPLFLLIGLAIKIEDRGPIFFKQARLGYGGEIFKIYKFRTMLTNAEKMGTGIFTERKDPRITNVGHLLRKTSLDELPQLINIAKGEMSFVGPRPPVPYHPYKYEDYFETQKLRFEVKPGVTGMAQVYGRNILTWDERIKYDVKYVKNQSFLLDVKILIKTVIAVVKKENIYRED